VKNRNKSIDKEAIGERIREQREALRLTREEFAEMVDLSPLYLGQIERGERQMSLSSLVKVSKCLHVSTDYLIFGKNTKNDDSKNRIVSLLNRCTSKQLMLVEEMIKVLISYVDDLT